MVEKFGKSWVLLICQVVLVTLLTNGILARSVACERKIVVMVKTWATKPFLRRIKIDDIMKIESLRYGKICGDRTSFHEIINMPWNK